MGETRSDILQGTLDLMVLQTLEAMGPLHGYGIARRIEQVSEDVLQLNQGTIYASLLRLQQRRWISASWGTSDNNRKAKFYTITKAGPEAAGRAGGELGADLHRDHAECCGWRSGRTMRTWLAVALSRTARALLLGRRLDDDFDREVAAHLAMLTDENIRRGLSPDEARRAAILRFGGSMQIKEQQHDDRGLPFVETTLQDLRYGVRALRKNPAYSLVAIATLAVGIGAGTAVFSIASAVLLRPLPYADPDRLVRVFETNPLKELDAQHRVAGELRRLEEAEHRLHRHRGIRAVQLQRQRRERRVPDRPWRAAGAEGAWRHRQPLRVLGAAPLIGRTFTDEETFEGKASGRRS